MLNMKRKSPFGTAQGQDTKELQVWDVPYLTSEARNKWADLNVTSFRNFVFEMDGLSLEDQKKLLKAWALKRPGYAMKARIQPECTLNNE